MKWKLVLSSIGIIAITLSFWSLLILRTWIIKESDACKINKESQLRFSFILCDEYNITFNELDNLNITELPPYLYKIKDKIDIINFRDNKVTKIDDSICEYTNLRVIHLHLQKDVIRYLPKCMWSMPNLKAVNLNNSKLSKDVYLPVEFVNGRYVTKQDFKDKTIIVSTSYVYEGIPEGLTNYIYLELRGTDFVD